MADKNIIAMFEDARNLETTGAHDASLRDTEANKVDEHGTDRTNTVHKNSENRSIHTEAKAPKLKEDLLLSISLQISKIGARNLEYLKGALAYSPLLFTLIILQLPEFK
jgi:hypothetical protein